MSNRDEELEALDPVCVDPEFAALDLGDRRLNARAKKMARALASRPSASLPDAMVSPAELEGCYRLLGNRRVTADALLQPHKERTKERCREHQEVLALADTTAMHFGGEDTRAGLGPVSPSDTGHGFKFHPTLAVAFVKDKVDVLGVLGSHVWARDQRERSPHKRWKMGELKYAEYREMPCEDSRWWDCADEVEKDKLDSVELIHVMDREADSFELLANMIKAKYRFVFRMCHNRRASPENSRTGSILYLKDLAKKFRPLCRRTATISPRGYKGTRSQKKATPARRGRQVKLSIAAGRVTIYRPTSARKHNPDDLAINLVHVREINTPRGEEPIEWFLITNEAIETAKDVKKVVDIYRARWVIEEFFCAIKTGCAYESRQLESLDTLHKALGFSLPIAWQLLRLKMLGRLHPDEDARRILTREQLYMLELSAEKPLSRNPTVLEAMLAIARLGGHLKQNGEPGWRILARGFLELMRRVLVLRILIPGGAPNDDYEGYRGLCAANLRCDQ